MKRNGEKLRGLERIAADHRGGIVMGLHIAAACLANYIAFLLHLGGRIPPAQWGLFSTMLPVVLACRMLAIRYFGLHRGFWRYTDAQDELHILWAALSSSIAFWCVTLAVPDYPDAVVLQDGLIFTAILFGLRIARRVWIEWMQADPEARRVLIIGAGDAGEMVARDMVRNTLHHRQPVAFIDDDPKKRGMFLRNIPILGGCAALEEAVSRVHPDEILIAISSGTPERIRAIIHRCKSLGLPIRTLPPLSDVLAGKARPTDIRNLDIEDVLGRAEITLMDPEVETTLQGRCVLVTGAGGSIGSELCRQVAAFRPERLLLFEQNENNLHTIYLALTRRFPKLHVEAILGDILDAPKLTSVFDQHKPQIVFHAAAYKHVPMMEMHPFCAVRNNILGTGQVLAAARQHGADRFVLISTDKAVAPGSVMGATKRIAEMLVQQAHAGDGGRTVAVRFGNVLESSGSVVPLFREQIRNGGPVTLTHPEMTRYFITISEAVRLVLHATVLGEGGETFVLDMGEPIKLADLARLMILLSGLSPDRDIRIEYIGLRPGEKLTERLFEEDEAVFPTRHERIRLARHPPLPRDLPEHLLAFSKMDHTTDRREIETRLRELIPTYRPAAGL